MQKNLIQTEDIHNDRVKGKLKTRSKEVPKNHGFVVFGVNCSLMSLRHSSESSCT